MNKCFVSKLKGVIDNDRLLKTGEIRIGITPVDSPTNKSQAITIRCLQEVEVKIIGNGYFTDSTLSQNLGKEKMLTSDTIYVSNGSFEVSIISKYPIYSLWDGDAYYTNVSNNKHVNLSDLKFSSMVDFRSKNVEGDLSCLEGKKLVNLYLTGGSVQGDFEKLDFEKTNMVSIGLPGIYGNSSNISNSVDLKLLNTLGSKVTIDTAYLKNDKMLDSVIGIINGDVANLKELQNLRAVVSYGGVLTGDIAVLGDLIRIETPTGNFNWTSRPSSSKIYGIIGNPKIDNVDKMLIDMSNCQAQSNTGFMVISAKGNRTSASDAAVATLQSKGYTVSIIPA